jgi:ABC-type dipeptide/oligopeptide/nickel transport system permease component
MLTYLVRRTLLLIPILIGVATVVFFGMRLSPGDPVRMIAGPLASEQKLDEIRHDLGLDKSLPVQYAIWFRNLLRGDLGNSIASGVSALHLVALRIGATLELTLTAFVLSLLIALVAGVTAAVRQSSLYDNLVTFGAMFWLSMPSFWLGLMFMSLLAVQLRFLPISGRGGPLWTWTGLRHLILPALTLGLPSAGATARIVRSSVLETLSQDYVRTARSKGLRERSVVVHHVLKNSLIPVITMTALRLPWLFGGAVIVETVFSWPGMGRLLTAAVFNRDYPVVQAAALITTALVVFANYAADVLYSVADPRIRLE